MKRSRPNRVLGVEFSDEIKGLVRLRTGNRCEVRLASCTGAIQQFHHRLQKGQGGKGTLANCIGSCLACHVPGIHANTGWSYRHGFLVRNGQDPAAVPVHRGCGGGCKLNHCDDTRGALAGFVEDNPVLAEFRAALER